MTPLVPSEMACLASSPGRMRRTAVWISREEMVDFLLYDASLDASVAMRSKMSLTNELRISMAWTGQRARDRSAAHLVGDAGVGVDLLEDLVDVGRVGLLARARALLLLLAVGRRGLGGLLRRVSAITTSASRTLAGAFFAGALPAVEAGALEAVEAGAFSAALGWRGQRVGRATRRRTAMARVW